MNRILHALNVYPGERLEVALLTLAALSMSMGSALGGIGAGTLVYSRVGVDRLPVLFILLGVVTMATSFAVTAVVDRLAGARLFLAIMLVLAAARVVAERVASALGWPSLYLVIWLLVWMTESLQNLAFWGIAGLWCDTRRAKRLFPVVGAGSMVGMLAGSLMTPLLLRFMGAEHLVLGSAGGLLGTWACCRTLLRMAPSAAPAPAPRGSGSSLLQQIGRGAAFVRATPFLRWMSAVTLLFVFLGFCLDAVLAGSAARALPTEETLGSFLGVFQGVTAAVTLLTSLFVAPRLFVAFGWMAILAAHALVTLSAFAAVAALGTFPVILAARLVTLAGNTAVGIPARQAVLNVVPEDRRTGVRVFFAGIPEQLGVVLSGVVLLVAQTAPPAHAVSFLALALAAICAHAALRARRAYSAALLEAVRNSGLPGVHGETHSECAGPPDVAPDRLRALAIERAEVARRFHALGREAQLRADETFARSCEHRAHHEAVVALRAMGSLGDRDAVEAALGSLGRRGSAAHANALELLEETCDRAIVRHLLPIFELRASVTSDGPTQAR